MVDVDLEVKGQHEADAAEPKPCRKCRKQLGQYAHPSGFCGVCYALYCDRCLKPLPENGFDDLCPGCRKWADSLADADRNDFFDDNPRDVPF